MFRVPQPIDRGEQDAVGDPGPLAMAISLVRDAGTVSGVGAYAGKGEVPVGFVVLKAGVSRPEKQILQELLDLVRERIGPVAFFKVATVVKRLPKTQSGKILRGTVKKIADALPPRPYSSRELIPARQTTSGP